MRSWQKLLKSAYTSLCKTEQDITTALENAQRRLDMGDEPLAQACVALTNAAKRLQNTTRTCYIRYYEQNPDGLKSLFNEAMA